MGNYKEAENYYLIGLKRLNKEEIGHYILYNNFLSFLCFKYKDYEKALFYCNKILDVYTLFDGAVELKAQLLIELGREKELIEWSKSYLERRRDLKSSKIFYQQIDNYKIVNNINISSKADFVTHNLHRGTGFSLRVSDYDVYQGDNDIFATILGIFTELNTKYYGLSSTLEYLKFINKIEDSKQAISIKEQDWQVITYQAEGWYSLINKDVINARKRFGQLIYFQIQGGSYETLYSFVDMEISNLDSIKINGYQGLRNILDNESEKYDGKGNLKILNSVCKTNNINKSFEIINNILNFGHTYLIEGKIEEAINIYKQLDNENMITVRQIIEKDLSDFNLNGLINKNDMEYIFNKLN